MSDDAEGWAVWKTAVVGCTAALLVVIAVAGILYLLLKRRRNKRHHQRLTDSVYSVPERWDTLSLSHAESSADFWKRSVDELADDGYLACLDKEIVRRLAYAHAYRNPMVNSCELRLDRIS